MIIPLLKETKYLEECLESIANQDIHNFDVLIVRDFPSDKVNEQIMEYAKVYAAKYPINQVECTEEHGLAAARNFGMSKAKGEYITFVDPEDMLEAGTLRALLEAVPNLPVPMVYTRVKPLHPLLSGYHEEYEEEVELLYETDTDRLSKRPAIDQALAVYDRTALQYMVELRDDLEDFTVLGCVFHKSFLKENDIIFDSNIILYPDAPFICKALIYAEESLAVEEGGYIRRSGTFRYSHEAGYNWQQRLQDYMRCYDRAYSYCISNLEMMLLVQETMCSRYVNVAIRLISKSKDQEFASSLYRVFANQMKRVDKRVVNSFSGAERKHLKLLHDGDMKRSIAYMGTFIKRKKRENLFQRKSNFLRYLAEKMFGNMDILERYIVFESARGQRYYGDVKYIYKYLQDNYPGEYRCVWVANDKELAKRIEGQRIIVKLFSLRYFYYILRAKYWIKDTRQPIWWYKSTEQVYISTWLNTPMEKLFLDKQAFNTVDGALRRGLKAQVEQWDAVISSNTYSSACYQSGLGVKVNQILQIGRPRNDYLMRPDASKEKARLKKSMGLPDDKKTILYAPVWREDEETDVEGYYKMQLGLHRMKEQLGDEYIVLIRIHDYITGKIILDQALEGFIYDFSFYDDVQELMMVSDVMITDYSSMVFDYACLRRPIYFYFYDFEEFEKHKEHFYFDWNEKKLPGPVCRTTQEIIDYMKNESKTKVDYKEAYDAFFAKYCAGSGRSAEMLARKMFVEMADVFAYEDAEKEV